MLVFALKCTNLPTDVTLRCHVEVFPSFLIVYQATVDQKLLYSNFSQLFSFSLGYISWIMPPALFTSITIPVYWRKYATVPSHRSDYQPVAVELTLYVLEQLTKQIMHHVSVNYMELLLNISRDFSPDAHSGTFVLLKLYFIASH